MTADQFTCDLGIPYWTKPCRWETHIRTSERRQTSVAGGGGCCRLPWTLPLPEPRFSTYVHVGRWWTRRTQQGRRERSQRPNPMVDPSFRRKKHKMVDPSDGTTALVRTTPRENDQLMEHGGFPFSSRCCRTANLPPSTNNCPEHVRSNVRRPFTCDSGTGR